MPLAALLAAVLAASARAQTNDCPASAGDFKVCFSSKRVRVSREDILRKAAEAKKYQAQYGHTIVGVLLQSQSREQRLLLHGTAFYAEIDALGDPKALDPALKRMAALAERSWNAWGDVIEERGRGDDGWYRVLEHASGRIDFVPIEFPRPYRAQPRRREDDPDDEPPFELGPALRKDIDELLEEVPGASFDGRAVELPDGDVDGLGPDERSLYERARQGLKDLAQRELLDRLRGAAEPQGRVDVYCYEGDGFRKVYVLTAGSDPAVVDRGCESPLRHGSF